MKRLIFSIFFITITLLLASYTSKDKTTISIKKEDKVSDILLSLGDVSPNHRIDLKIKGASLETGRSLVLEGIATSPNGDRTKRQSKHFVCTSCHNVKKEDPDLRYADPQARLDYSVANNLPFLQGSTLYGIVNRTNFYNGDYEKKYGDLVKPARNNLREAIQLCATECSQGRALEDWEMESVLMYLWSIGLKMEDLNLSESDWERIQTEKEDKIKHVDLVKFIKTFYLNGSPATFADAPKDRVKGYPHEGNPDNGKKIYEQSCLHCHEKGKYSYFDLDDSTFSFKFLKKTFPMYNYLSVYEIARYGVSPENGRHSYMPNYTLEKMSHQQMEDLRAYVEKMSK